ncbi:MAG TPA: outer membrane beta-barrel protein [Flavisolibacter sp.]|nr:outer membrane beta-barrel protein [Flavisolibacter sp.]
MKHCFTLFLVLIISISRLAAQGSIKGKLTDTVAKHPLALATVTVFKAADTTLVTYRLSNPEGEFKVPGLALNMPYRVIISYSGYDAYRKEFTLTDDTPLDLGTVVLTPVTKSLDEVLVIAERPPVTIRRDTIEFNASSFKTLPTSLVEDLLKKLPGVQVDADGNITANGKKVNRILVDGKSFFGDDPKMATRNLPANVIDKIQVTEDKDEAARNTNGDLTNVGQVINLTLKKGVKKGWFGKLYAGGGNKDRYEAGGIANIYRDTMQLSLLAFSNNLNRSGFSFKEVQDLGGLNRSGANSMMIMSRGGQTGFAINGISFGGLDAGLATTTGAGFNLNHAPSKKRSFFIQYFFGNTRNNIQTLNNSQQFIHDTTINTRMNTENNRDVFTHNFSTGFMLKPDSVTDVNFRASYGYSNTAEDIDALINVSSNKSGDLSTGAGNQFNHVYSSRYNHTLFFTKRSRVKKGRVWNFNNFFTYNKNLQRYITESISEYFEPSYSLMNFNQLRRLDIPTLSAQTSLSYAEPLTTKLTFRFNNRYDYLKDRQDIGIFDKDIATSKYELFNYAQSSGFERQQNRFNSYVGLTYKVKKVTMSAGVSGLWQSIVNEFKSIARPFNTTLFNIVPSASFQWKQLSANYSMNVSAPSINYLSPVPDSTNPFYIRFGNPLLKPVTQHQFYVSNFNFFQGSGASYNFYVNGNIANNDVVMSRTVAANGVQTDRPVNANGTVTLYAGVGAGKEWKNKQKFIFSFRFSPYINYNRRRLIVNNNVSTAKTLGYGPSLNINLNWNDIVELRPSYSPGISRTTYTDPYFRNIKAVTQYIETELIVRWPKKLVWETNMAYRYTSQVAPGLPKANVLWNAAVTLLMFKGDVGLLKFSVFDILDRNNGFYRYTNQNQIVDQQTNVLQRFGELSFTYNIRNMGAPKKVGGRDRLFIF